MTRCILAGVDGSEQSAKAFKFALELARFSGAQLHACAAVYSAEFEMAEPQELAALKERAEARMLSALAQIRTMAEAENLPLTAHLLDGHPVEEILTLAGQLSADHIVVGHRSKGLFERLLMGSVARRVVDLARCSVTVVR